MVELSGSAPPGQGGGRPLTIHERVLLHLAPFAPARDAYTVPKAVTQAGISAAVGIRVAHASRELRNLIDAGLLEERGAAVEGSRRKLKAYFLSAQGLASAGRLRAERGLTQAHLQAAAQDPTAAPDPGPPRFVVRDFPAVRYFFGRADELDLARRALQERPLLVVLGIAGIGKSTFGAHLFESTRTRRPSAWVSLRDYDTAPSSLAPIARMLALVGKPRLELFLRREADLDLARAKEFLCEDLAAGGAAVFLDDVQNAGTEVLQAVLALKEAAVASSGAFKLVLLSRTRPPVYDERDLRVRKTAAELELSGLAPVDAQRLLEVSNAGLDGERVYRITGGHPLFIELLRDAQDGSPATSLDHRPLDRFVVDQIFSALDAGERETLRRCAFFRRPIDPRAFLPSSSGLEGLLALEARSLVRRDARGRVVAHEAIRDFVRRALTASEEEAYARESFRALFEAAEQAEDALDAGEAIEHFEDALPLAPDEASAIEVLAELAACHLTLGQYSQAAARLKEALPLLGAHPDPAEGGEVFYLMGAVNSEVGASRRAREFLERAWAAASAAPGPFAPARSRVALEFARWEQRYGVPGASTAWIDRAVELAEGRDRPLMEAEAAILRSHILPVDTSNGELERAIAIAKAHGYLPTLSRAHMMLAWHMVDAYGDTHAAAEHGREALRIATGLSNPALISQSNAAIAKALWRAGDLEAALAAAGAAMAQGGEHSIERIVPVALLSTLTTESGDPRRGESIARTLLQSAEKTGTPFEVLMAKRALMRSLVSQGRNDEARELLVDLQERYVRHGTACDLPLHIATLMRLVRVEVARGRKDEALRWKAQAERLLPGLRTPAAAVFENLIVGHFNAGEAPGLAAAGYFKASRALGAIGWRAMQARMLQAAWTQRSEAEGRGAAVPEGVPSLDLMQGELDRVAGSLKVPARASLAAVPEL